MASQDQPSQQQSQPQEAEGEPTAFEIPLAALIECMSLFGNTVGSSSSNATHRVWHTGHSDEEDNQEEGTSDRARQRQNVVPANGRIDQYFGGEKGAGLRFSYVGAGHPLTLLMYAHPIGGIAYADEFTGRKSRMALQRRVRSPRSMPNPWWSWTFSSHRRKCNCNLLLVATSSRHAFYRVLKIILKVGALAVYLVPPYGSDYE